LRILSILSKLGNKQIFIFKIVYDPLIFAYNSFPIIQSINSDRDDVVPQSYVKTDLAYTETKRNRL
jgi:hypothetical protein